MGGHSIACINSRDRNLLGFRRDLLTAAAYGVGQFLFVYGDKPGSGGRTSELTVRSMIEEARTSTAADPAFAGVPPWRIGVAAALRPLPRWKQTADFIFTQVSYSAEASCAGAAPTPSMSPSTPASWSSPARPWPGAWPPPSPTSRSPAGSPAKSQPTRWPASTRRANRSSSSATAAPSTACICARAALPGDIRTPGNPHLRPATKPHPHAAEPGSPGSRNPGQSENSHRRDRQPQAQSRGNTNQDAPSNTLHPNTRVHQSLSFPSTVQENGPGTGQEGRVLPAV